MPRKIEFCSSGACLYLNLWGNDIGLITDPNVCCHIIVVDGAYVPNLGSQFLHKEIKDEHQPSGRNLLLTISTSVGKYLCAGQLRKKTHLKSKETHPSIQVKKHQPLGACRSTSHGSMGPPEQATNLEQG